MFEPFGFDGPIAAVGLDGENRMAFAVQIPHDRHQERLTGEAPLDEQLAFEQRIDLAVESRPVVDRKGVIALEA